MTDKPRGRKTVRPFLLIVTTLVSRHETEREARTALKRLKPKAGALGVVVKEKVAT